MFRVIVFAAFALAASCATPAPQPQPLACDVSAEDRAWMEQAIDAWRFSMREITGMDPQGDFGAVFFDGACTLTSPNALSVQNPSAATWSAAPHAEIVLLPNGDEMPAGVTSFASGGEGVSFFVMSTPSVWRAGGVRGDPISLEELMTFVLLHEGSHVAQMSTYGVRIGAIAEANNLGEDFNDDSMQGVFGGNAEFTASVLRETELFVQAAAAADDAEALRLAREARDMMKARGARYFTGAYAYYTEAEAVFLTFEGAGQWAGYQWLIHPQGRAMDRDLARRAAMRSRWWSQNEGLAIALVLDRLGPQDWRRTAFGDGSRNLIEMLDAALAR